MNNKAPARQRRLPGRLLWVLLLFLALELAYETLSFQTKTDKAQGDDIVSQVPPVAVAGNANAKQPIALNQPGAKSRRTQPGGHFTLLAQSPGAVRFRFELGEFQLQEITRPDGTYSQVSLPRARMLQRRGQPELPVFRTDFALLHNASGHLQISNLQQEEIPCSPPLPSPGEQLWTERNTTALPDPAIYQGNQPYPAQLAALTESYQVRNVTGQSLQVSPLQYLPQEGKLLVCRSFEATLTFRDENGSESQTLPQLDDVGSFATLQERLFLNGTGLTRSDNSSIGQLLLILPDAWAAASNSFATWKRQLGFAVSLARYPTDTGSGSSNVANYIASAYNDNGTSHVVIIGDWNNVPPYRVTSGSSNQPPNPNVSLDVTSDTPYACLAGDDLKADILLSRISVGNVDALTAVLAKLQAHEDARGITGDSWQQRGLFLASADGNSSTSFDWDTEVEPFSYVSKDYAYIDYEFNTLKNAGLFLDSSYRLYANATPSPSASAVSNKLNAGVSLLYYLGHGQINHYSTSEFSSADAQNLSNAGKLPFIMAPVCHTGNFAYIGYDCLSEALLNKPNGGAAAVIACTGESYWRAPIVAIWEFTDSILAADSAQRALDNGSYAWQSISKGIDYCLDTGDDERDTGEYFMHLMHLFGDCSQTPRIGAFRDLKVDYQWTVDGLQVTTTWDDNTPAPYVAVCLEISNTAYISGRTSLAGSITLATSVPLFASTLRISDPSAPLQEFSILGSIDQDQNGNIGHQELLTWLGYWLNSATRKPTELQNALSQWATSGYQGTRQKTVISSAQFEAKTYPLPTRKITLAWQDRNDLDRLARTGVEIIAREDDIIIVHTDTQGADNLLAQGFTILANEPLSSVPETREVGLETEYPTYAEVNATLLTLARENWHCSRPSFVGKSTQGREILAARLSLAPAGAIVPELLIVGGIHGDERPSVDMPLKLLQYLLQKSRGSDEEALQVQHLLQNCVLWVLPVLNPDGMVNGSRRNSNSADLNRYFPDGVLLAQAGASLGTFLNADSLRLAELQPEQIVLMRWLAARNITAALHLHTGAELVCYPYGNYDGLYTPEKVQTPHNDIFLDLANVYANNNPRINSVRNAGEWIPVIGELADWQYRYLGSLPLTVELVGPASNKEPLYSTMPTLWDENRPAFLAWMAKVIELYPEGISNPSNENPSAKFLSTQKQYLPGFAQPLAVKCDNFAAAPAALILSVTLPEYWQAGTDASATLPARATRQENEHEFSFVFLPEEDNWGERILAFTATPPEDTTAEAILHGTLFWDGDSQNLPSAHWLPMPERDYALSLQAGWNLRALPLTPRASSEWPNTLRAWHNQAFATAQTPQQNIGFWLWQENDASLSFSGWHRDEESPLPSGWHLRGTTWSQPLTNIFRTEQNGSIHKVPAAINEPPQAFWLFVP